MMTTESGTPVYGNWRSGAYGANRKAHLFTVPFGETKKWPACGARLAYDKTGRVQKRALRDLCYDCLAAGAAGRA